ncbi:MAG TPA: hypothetical protein VFZ25_04835, partial [Chloroflexota bacterium]|nr:hypothetical protein [Chloroflexota bacterium]
MIAPVHGPDVVLLPLTLLIALLASVALPPGAARHSRGAIALGVGGTIIAGLFTAEDLAQTLAVATTAFLLAGGLPRSNEAAMASRRTLTWLAIAASALLLSLALDVLNARQALPGLAGPIGGLFVVGVAIVVGAFPFGFWLPPLAEESPAFAAVIAGLLGLGAALLGATMLTASPWRMGSLAAGPLLTACGIAGAGAAILAIGEKQPARVFAYLISADAALGLGGLVAAPAAPVVFALSAHALAASLGLAVLAGARPRLVGLWGQQPALAIALLVAAGSLVGFPLTAGFAAHVALSRLADTVTLLYPAFAALV